MPWKSAPLISADGTCVGCGETSSEGTLVLVLIKESERDFCSSGICMIACLKINTCIPYYNSAGVPCSFINSGGRG